ncbi:response regulator transcription factor [Phycicoccus sp. MAQZ13P-2]|uniref:response regulator transcription factor n=1 Tax=Phycicoccus mangrovi TaxID=2840470 RepID=UPI001C0085EE|nr:response regulator transcription factor [Phycicoccus mangrovi]MBT9256791.1 response regulator transcription factor [Phycicoccus mangrovi]MBT9275060.1 response regulator transcription factor [Phycicoccus mangrovi]
MAGDAATGGTGSVRIGAVDDHPVILAGLAHGLRWHLPTAVLRPVHTTVAAFLDRVREPIDLVLLDVELHDGSDAAENVTRLVARGFPVLMFTQDHRHHALARCLRAGASGILSKGEDLATVASAVRAVADGEPYLSPDWASVLAEDAVLTPQLTPREMEAVRLYAAGMKLTSVARRLNVSEDTARTYLLRARTKYADVGRPAPTKTDLYIRAVEDGILPVPGSPPATER